MRRYLLASVLLCACPPAAGTTTDTAPTSSTSSTTSTSTGDTTSSSTSAPTTTSTGPAVPDLPPPCPVGSEGCPCTGGGACDDGLACDAGTCVASCAVGAEGCPCTLGDGCDPGLVCAGDVCVGGVSPPCEAGNQDDCCGDGVLDEHEECDAGFANMPGTACTPECKMAVCGDGYVYDQLEACDGESFCAADCTFLTCGDGEVQNYEWCEKTRPGDPECTDLCTDARKLVFITSMHYKGGELGGLVGAHALCQMHADAAGLGVKVRAFLGTTPENAPVATLPLYSGVPLVDVAGGIVGPDVQSYCGGDLATIPDELGNPHPGCAVEHLDTAFWVWGVFTFNSPTDPPTCDGWTNTAASGGAAIASSCAMSGFGAPCDAAAPIYCIET